MFDFAVSAAFLLFVLSPCIIVLRPGADRSEDQRFVL